MADSILRLRVESQEYDQKIKRAAEGIQQYAQKCREAGGTLEHLDDGVEDFVRSLGQMDTVSKSTKGSVNELTKAFTDLSVQYNKLTAEEKKSPFGQALSSSLDQMKARIQEGNAEIKNISGSLNGSSGLSGALDTIAGKFGISTDMLTKFGGGIAAATTALKVIKDAFFQSESNIDEWGRTLKGAEGAYDVFLQTLNNGNWSNFFSNLETAIRGGRDLYDVFDRLGSIKANNAVAIATTQAEIQQLRLLKQQGQNVDDKIKDATQRLKSLQTQSTNAGIIAGRGQVVNTLRNGVNSIGGAPINNATLDRVADNIAKQGQAYFDYMKRRATNLEQRGMVTRTQTITDSQGGTYQRRYREFDINALTKEQQKQYAIAKVVTERETSIQKGLSLWSQAVNEQASNAREQFRDNRYALQGSRGSSGGRATGGGGSGTTKQEQAQAKLDRAQNDYNQVIELATLELKAGTIKEADYNKKKLAAQESLWKAIGDAREIYDSPQLKDAQDKAAAEIVRLGGEVTANIEAQKRMQESAKRVEQAQKRLADAQQRLAEARESGSATAIYKAQQDVNKEAKATERTEFEESVKNGTITELPNGLKIEVVVDVNDSDAIKKISDIQNLNFDPATLTVVTDDAQALADLQKINGVKLDTKTIKVKTDNETSGLESLKRSIRDELEIEHVKIDGTTLHTILKDAVQKNINGMDLQLSGLSDQIAKGIDIPDTQWESILDQYNQLRAQIGEKPIEVNLKTGQLAKDGEAATESWKKASSAINSASGALSSIENPAAKIMGTIGQAIATIALAYAETLAQSKEKRNVWAFIATAAAAMISMATTISSIHSSTGYASGGIVDGRAGGFVGGTAYSGDNVGNVRLSSGELVLNRSQQNNLANALEGGMKQIHIVGQLKGEDIVLMADRYGRRSGLGELAFWK